MASKAADVDATPRNDRQLNIKDARTVRLARDIAARRGQTVTAVIRQALEREEAAQEADIERKIQGGFAILRDVRAMWKPGTRNLTFEEIMNAMYDDDQPDGFAK